MSSLRSDIAIEYADVFTSSSTQACQLGSRATTGDGRYFRYALVGATSTVAGQVYQAPASDPTNFSPSGGLTIGQANATGTNTFTISDSITLTANQLANGLVSVVASTGIGQTYQIKSNTAVTSATGASFVLWDNLRTNLATSSKVVFFPNPYNGIVVAGSSLTAPIVGVAPSVITNAQYGWIQTKGLIGVLVTGPTVPGDGQPVGYNLVNVTGSVAIPTGVLFSQVGVAAATGTSGEYDMVLLSLEN